MEVMYHRKNGKRYEVYDYITEEGKHTYAVCYDTEQAGRCGQGWCRMRLKDLVPECHANSITGQFMSKTERNAIKSRLEIVSATWRCTDGTLFDHSLLDEAINHQKNLDSNI